MDFEWDDNKNRINIEKHGIDFREALLLFDEVYYVSKSPYELEERFIATGELGGNMTSVVYALRDEKIRIISARAAKRREVRLYRAWRKERS